MAVITFVHTTPPWSRRSILALDTVTGAVLWKGPILESTRKSHSIYFFGGEYLFALCLQYPDEGLGYPRVVQYVVKIERPRPGECEGRRSVRVVPPPSHCENGNRTTFLVTEMVGPCTAMGAFECGSIGYNGKCKKALPFRRHN